jgi:hypothetical protein
MRINWEGQTPSLRLEICGLEGKVILHRDVPFPELQAK